MRLCVKNKRRVLDGLLRTVGCRGGKLRNDPVREGGRGGRSVEKGGRTGAGRLGLADGAHRCGESLAGPGGGGFRARETLTILPF